MRRITLLFFALAAAPPLLSGCNGMTGSSSVSTSTTTTAGLAGNWEFTTLYPGPVPVNIIYTGALSGQGANISGVLRTNTCFSPTQDITVTGTEDAKGNLTLLSNNLPNNLVLITATLAPSTGGLASGPGNISVTGSIPCAPLVASISANQFPPLTGTFAGTMSSASSAMVAATATLSQSDANADGLFSESGTITITGSGCANTFPVAGLFAGTPFTANLTSSSGPAATATLSAGVPYGSPATISTSISIVSAGCTAGSFAGTLTKQ